MVGQIFADQMEVTIRHHALEAGCFVVNATGWLSDEQITAVTTDPAMQRALRGGCCTAIVSPEGAHLCPPLREGEGIAIADLDLALIVKRKRMMDSVGHYARPELLSLRLDPAAHAAASSRPASLRSPHANRSRTAMSTPQSQPQFLITELQSLGLRLADPAAGAEGRRGGAGPSDHKAVTIGGRTVMVPVHNDPARLSPYRADAPDARGVSTLSRDGVAVGEIGFPRQPRFYKLQTLDGVPYWKIAVLHGADVLATTVLQTCIRYGARETSCQFCAIGQSLDAGRTIARKTPEQLAEVARAAVLLDGIRHMVMTTGTPNDRDRGAVILCESAFAIKAAVPDLPIQGQCEPPDDPVWFRRMRAAGIDALGMHLEAVTPETRARIMPGKAKVPLARYLEAFAAAVPVFGRGQVSTYILAGSATRPTPSSRCASA